MPRGRIAAPHNIVVLAFGARTAGAQDMAKANKSIKTAGNAASVKPGKVMPKGEPVLRSIKGGKNGGKDQDSRGLQNGKAHMRVTDAPRGRED